MPAVDLGDQVVFMLESLALSEASLRCTFEWAGDEYACTAGPEKDGMRLDEGGYRQVRSVQIKVRTELFPTGVGVPQKKQTILYKKNASATPKQYRITSITDYYGAVMELNCEDPNASA
jgi:hypothetical protein